MSAVANITNFSVPTGAIGTTLNVPHGLGVTPKAIILWGSGRTESVDTTGTANHDIGIGFGTSTTNRFAVSNFANDSTATAETGRRSRNDAVYCASLVGLVADGLLDINAMDATNVQFIVDEVFTVAFRVFMLAIAGDDITNANVQSFQTATVAGNQDVTTFAFQPDVVLMVSIAGSASANTLTTSALLSIGAAASSTEEAALFCGSEHTPTNMDTYSFCRGDKCLVCVNSVTADPMTVVRAEFVQFLSNGFRINWLEAPARADFVFALDIKGGGHNVKTILTSTVAGTNLLSGTLNTAQVRGALHLSTAKAETADGTSSVSMYEWSMGGWTGLTTRGVHAVIDEDGVATSDVYTKVEYDNIFADLSGTGADEGLVDIDIIGTTSFELDQTTASSGAADFTWFWSFGDNLAVAAPVIETRVPEMA